MKRTSFLCAMAAVSLLMDCPRAWSGETGFLNRALKIDGEDYRYAVYVPRDWTRDGEKRWPVILFLHGYGEAGDDGMAPTQVGIGRAIRYHPERFPFIVVFPQFPWHHLWVEQDSAHRAIAALDAATREFNGDSDRTYLTGISMGGYGTWYIASHYAGRFAAIAPVAGGVRAAWAGRDAQSAAIYDNTAARISTTPVWIFHGASDPTIPVDEARAMFGALKRSGGNVRFYEYEGVGHDSWDRAYGDAEFPAWLLQHRLSEDGKLGARAEKIDIPLVPRLARVDPRIYGEYLGSYEYPIMPGSVYRMVIAREGDGLTGQGDTGPTFSLLPLSATRFWNADRGVLVFERDKTGREIRLLVTDPDERNTKVYVKVHR